MSQPPHLLPTEAASMGEKNHSEEPRRGRRETCLHVPAEGEPARQKWGGELQPGPAEGRAAEQAGVGGQGCSEWRRKKASSSGAWASSAWPYCVTLDLAFSSSGSQEFFLHNTRPWRITHHHEHTQAVTPRRRVSDAPAVPDLRPPQMAGQSHLETGNNPLIPFL